eukprot:scaffold16594_cov124-Isochrysis_galbana.AAC.4
METSPTRGAAVAAPDDASDMPCRPVVAWPPPHCPSAGNPPPCTPLGAPASAAASWRACCRSADTTAVARAASAPAARTSTSSASSALGASVLGRSGSPSWLELAPRLSSSHPKCQRSKAPTRPAGEANGRQASAKLSLSRRRASTRLLSCRSGGRCARVETGAGAVTEWTSSGSQTRASVASIADDTASRTSARLGRWCARSVMSAALSDWRLPGGAVFAVAS